MLTSLCGFEGGGLSLFMLEHFFGLDSVRFPFVLVQMTGLNQILVDLRWF